MVLNQILLRMYPNITGKNINIASPIVVIRTSAPDPALYHPIAKHKALRPFIIPAADKTDKIGWKIPDTVSTSISKVSFLLLVDLYDHLHVFERLHIHQHIP